MRAAVTLSLLLLSAPLPAAARTAAQVQMSDDPQMLAIQEQYGFADAVTVGDTIYLSGLIAAPLPGETDPAAAYDRAFVALGRTLNRAGAGWSDVIEMTSFHTDLPNQFASFAAVKSRYLKAPFPAWTAIGVSNLAVPNGLVEIKLIAHRPTAGHAHQ